MIVACPSCRQQLLVDPTHAGKQVQCGRCKQLITITISPAPPPAATPSTSSVPVNAPAPVLDTVPRVEAAMRLSVQFSCVVDLEDQAMKAPDVQAEVRWREAIRQVALQVDRPETGTVDLPMT